MKRWMLPILLSTLLSLGMLTAIYVLTDALSDSSLDMVAVNHLAYSLSENYESLETREAFDTTLQFVVIDGDDNLHYRQGWDSYTSLHDAIKERDTVIDLPDRDDGAKLVIRNTAVEEVHRNQRTGFILFSVAMVAMLAINSLYTLYLYKKILRPFENMRAFASRIAHGNFDVPLEMDRDNVFGAFTESFDMMRNELHAAHKRERLAELSKQELIAQLSHDIKTPLASITAISELSVLQTEDLRLQKQLELIRIKAEQIDRLLSDLFNTTLEELDKLPIRVQSLDSGYLVKLIKTSDYEQRCRIDAVADCLIEADPLRLQQVFDNIIVNSYKYADTAIEVATHLENHQLIVEIKDEGPGISEEELPLIFGKFYRGNNAADKAGAGLGLYTSKFLLEQMHGELACRNVPGGFVVTVRLPLS